MPYIKKSDRSRFDFYLDALNANIISPGEFNYCVSRLAWDMVKRLGGNYAACNTVIGALECAKLELYRRIIAPYENDCIERNGDIL
jgi:hypothetical protein